MANGADDGKLRPLLKDGGHHFAQHAVFDYEKQPGGSRRVSVSRGFHAQWAQIGNRELRLRSKRYDLMTSRKDGQSTLCQKHVTFVSRRMGKLEGNPICLENVT